MTVNSSYSSTYLNYLQQICPSLPEEKLSGVKDTLSQTNWDEPQSALDLNNCAVLALIEAEQAEELTTRELYLEMAITALTSGSNHPLCAAHLALVHCLIGETEISTQLAFSTFITTLQTASVSPEISPPGLIYLPLIDRNLAEHQTYLFSQLFLAEQSSDRQSILLLTEVLWRSESIFYNSIGLRLLHLAIQLAPDSVALNVRLGISNLINAQEEGIFYLHRAVQRSPQNPSALQALYLAYRDLGQLETAAAWLNVANQVAQSAAEAEFLAWQWVEPGLENPITYIPFEKEILLAVEASLHSIVTSILLGAGDWFETEMEFWRDLLQPGMTVIDVGANVGIYTFSAAKRVGSKGRVLAVEPFTGCVRCLEESCRVNQIHWVRICAGAASDRTGTAHLSLHDASELNEILIEDTPALPDALVETVACFTLDSLIESEQLDRIDLLKIDAENHEMAVLQGSTRVLAEFSPVILYENIAASKGANLPVADLLRDRGYELFYYQPYLKKIVPIKSPKELETKLNVIAFPANKIPAINS